MAEQDINLGKAVMCGYLKISGLTDEFPVLTTYFEAEIVGKHHAFVTDKWDADEHTDRDHWSKFPAFSRHASNMKAAHMSIDPSTSDFIFMRWKEHFLVPDHRIVSIPGASFAGFYYCVYERAVSAPLCAPASPRASRRQGS